MRALLVPLAFKSNSLHDEFNDGIRFFTSERYGHRG